ncbi:hypothetical protein ACFQ0K_03880 [Nocardioides caeni]|uniref:Lipoprotein n=1 Tax=Nocardioides caeni TaxID=574700 RepID=A0A4S8N0R8_9ACTN|nr:hypothetical protein [Nocardioides caeni]THV09051.1 hypothetical protein E9934_17860 [Nocardioides caeni]
MKFTSRKVSKAILFAVPAIVFIACASDTGDDESTSGKNDDSVQSGEKQADAPKDAKGGVVGNWDILNKPTFAKEFDSFKSFKLNVRNNSDDNDTPFFEVRLTNKPGDLVATFDCSGDEIEPGQKASVNCFSFDDFTKDWTDYEIKNAF